VGCSSSDTQEKDPDFSNNRRWGTKTHHIQKKLGRVLIENSSGSYGERKGGVLKHKSIGKKTIQPCLVKPKKKGHRQKRPGGNAGSFGRGRGVNNVQTPRGEGLEVGKKMGEKKKSN